jgi:CTP synthase
VHSTDLEKGQGWEAIEAVDGIVVPGGFGSRGIEGKIKSAEYARTHKIPYLGLCLGMQLMVVDFARDVFATDKANSTEFERSTPHPVIDLMPDQHQITDMGGTMRLGLYPCHLQPGTIASDAYSKRWWRNVTATVLNSIMHTGRFSSRKDALFRPVARWAPG